MKPTFGIILALLSGIMIIYEVFSLNEFLLSFGLSVTYSICDILIEWDEELLKEVGNERI